MRLLSLSMNNILKTSGIFQNYCSQFLIPIQCQFKVDETAIARYKGKLIDEKAGVRFL
jgi:hypothetical protein